VIEMSEDRLIRMEDLLTQLVSMVGTLKVDVDIIKSDMDTMKNDIADVKCGLTEFKETNERDHAEIMSRLKDIESDQIIFGRKPFVMKGI
jgi:hypothetical protein